MLGVVIVVTNIAVVVVVYAVRLIENIDHMLIRLSILGVNVKINITLVII